MMWYLNQDLNYMGASELRPMFLLFLVLMSLLLFWGRFSSLACVEGFLGDANKKFYGGDFGSLIMFGLEEFQAYISSSHLKYIAWNKPSIL